MPIDWKIGDGKPSTASGQIFDDLGPAPSSTSVDAPPANTEQSNQI